MIFWAISVCWPLLFLPIGRLRQWRDRRRALAAYLERERWERS